MTAIDPADEIAVAAFTRAKAAELGALTAEVCAEVERLAAIGELTAAAEAAITARMAKRLDAIAHDWARSLDPATHDAHVRSLESSQSTPTH